MESNIEMTTSKKYEIMRVEILDYIRKIGFTPINVQCGNGYFIFDMAFGFTLLNLMKTVKKSQIAVNFLLKENYLLINLNQPLVIIVKKLKRMARIINSLITSLLLILRVCYMK